MPAESQAQRSFLYATKGAAWVKKHGFDNKGKLPEHVNDNPRRQQLKNARTPKRSYR
jgi:hypothetical protein